MRHVAGGGAMASTTHGGLLYYVVSVPRDSVSPSGLRSDASAQESAVNSPELISTDSGWDNPFRPDGDLSREADEIVQLIKGGKQLITQTHAQAHEVDGSAVTNGALQLASAATQQSSPPAAKPVNGTAAAAGDKKQSPAAAAKTGAVELQRGVTANDASQVEHVVLKKKPKCKCCVIQ